MKLNSFYLSRLDERNIIAKLEMFCQTNFDDCHNATIIFSEIVSGVIKSIFRKTRFKQSRPPKSQRKQPFIYKIQVAKRVFRIYKTE